MTDPEAIIDALMKSAAAKAEVPDEDPVDAKLVRAFDKLIRNKGLAEPFKKQRGAEYPTFRDSLRWIAAEDCLTVVEEFLEWIEPARSTEGDIGVATLFADNESKVVALTERYAAVPELPGDLLKDYLKERKKLAK